jgi:hypothetical protein
MVEGLQESDAWLAVSRYDGVEERRMIDDQITVVIPTSPIPDHPSTVIIEKTIQSIRFHLPESQIIVMADGVRPQVEHRRAQYEEYKNQLSKRLLDYGRIEMAVFDQPTQQAWMLRETLKQITTPLVLFIEHDTYLPTTWSPRDDGSTHPEDCTFAWQDIADIIMSGQVNMVRFYLWQQIWHEHEHLMHGKLIQGNSTFVKTTQYSQWPCIAAADFYRKILTEHFQPTERKMIEIGMYGPVANAPWEQYRIAIYYPEPNARRFYHMNGRVDTVTGVRDPAEW